MALELHNTLSRKKEPFVPQGKTVTIYSCGPTVYDTAHIGNLRTYVFGDTLRRWLRHGHGLTLNQAMNITDVEDKIIKGSKAKTAADLPAFTKPHERQFFADVDALGIERVETYPKATEHIKPMITLVERILANGFAYERDGSVYFDLRKYGAQHTYGQLLNVDFSGFAEGHRIDNDEYEKDNVQDFALWKAVEADSPGWDSPWGHGRPGWHLECSVMAGELAPTVDIHTGAVDLIFPHHENEIAQTKAATGNDLAKVWLHAEHLRVDDAKMAKSAKNFYTLADVTKKGYAPAVLRMLFLGAHYRSKLNFTWESLDAARESFDRLQEFRRRLSEATPGQAAKPGQTLERLADAQAKFIAAMNDDLATPEALAVVFELVRDLNARIDAGELGEDDLAETRDAFERFDAVLGLASPEEIEVPAAVQALVDDRETARTTGDFDASDKLRVQIETAGYAVEDTERGPRVRRKTQ